MVRKFNVGDRVVFINDPGRYIIKDIRRTFDVKDEDLAGMHGTICRYIPPQEMHAECYEVMFDNIKIPIYTYESLLSFELEDGTDMDRDSINSFLGI